MKETKRYFEAIGTTCILIKELGDARAKEYLYQKSYLDIQKGNASRVHGTLPNIVPIEDMYNL